MQKPTIIVLMGTMSSGKTLFGKLLAESLGWEFFEADRFHKSAMKEKMHAGIPLTDADREPWLQDIAAAIKEQSTAGKPSIFICSALKKKYRNLLRVAPLQFIHLYAPKPVLEHRAQTRTHEFMPPSLLQSQLETLEPPDGESDVISVNTDGPAHDILEQLLTIIAPRQSR